MDHSTKNNDSKSVENRLPVPTNSTAMNSFDPLHRGGNIFGVDNMSMVNPASTPLCADLLGNMEESKSCDQVRPHHNDNTMNRASLISQFWVPQIARSPFNSEDTKVAGVNPQILGEEATLASHVHGDAISSAETMHFSSLFGNTEIPQIDINNISNGVSAEIQRHSFGEITPETDIASIQRSRALGDNFMNVASQFNDFRFPQITRDKRSVGGGTLAGDQIHNHGGSETDTFHVHGSDSNNEIMFSSLFSNYHNPQNEKSSVRVGSNRAQMIQQNSQGETTIGTSHVQSARSNVDSSMSLATQLQNLPRLQVNKNSKSIGVKRPAAVQPNSQVKIGTTRSHMHGGIRNSNVDTTIPILFSNNLRDRQINRSPISIEGGLSSTRRANSQDQVMDRVDLGSNAVSLNGMHSSLTDRNFGGSMHDIRHYQIQENERSINHARANEDHCSSVFSSEQTGNSFLNLGFGGNTPMGLRSDDSGRGIYGSNEYPVTSQTHAFNGNFLSLGGDLGNQTWSDNANTINFGTNAVVNFNPYTSLQGNVGNQAWSDNVNTNNFGTNSMVNSNPYTSLRGNMGNQTRSNNGTSIVFGTNIVDNSNSFTNSQTVQDNVHKYIPRPSGHALIPGGNGAVTYANAVPYRGFTGHPGVAVRPFNSIPGGLHANEQARVPNFRLERSSQGEIPNKPLLNPSQQALNNVRRISTTSSMTSLLNSAAARTSRQGQSGTRVPAEGIQYTQSPKVLLGPSVRGTPVPVARRVGLAQTSEALLRQNIQSGNIPNSSTTLYAPRGRKVLQSTVNPSTQSGSQTNAVYHLKWKGTEESFKSTGDKCLLCKRDLTYTATGPVFQPSAPPGTAVLPCGHTFHDECLQRITPEDQLKNPPCIPCAIGTF